MNGNVSNSKKDQIPEPSYVGVARCLSGYSSLSYDPVKKSQQIGRTPSPLRIESLGTENGSINNNIFADEFGKKHLTKGRKYCDSSPESLTMNGGNSFSSHVRTSSSYSSRQVTLSSSSTYSPEERNNTLTSFSTPNGCGTTSSFIVQRVERLYGPGALAQSFYSRFTPSPSSRRISRNDYKTPDNSMKPIDGSKSAPVMRLLSPEFRAQLTATPKNFTESPLTHRNLKREIDMPDACILEVKPSFESVETTLSGNHFLDLLNKQVVELERLAEQVEKEVESAPSEEVAGILRATSGKSRLLVAEKLNQFRGLCHKNLEQSQADDFPTTVEDLAGFWDMVMIQVKEVLNQFDNIEKMRLNNWQLPDKEIKSTLPSGKNPLKKKPGVKVPAPQSEAAKARDAARKKMIEERRQRMKNTQSQNDDAPLLFF